MLFGRVTSGAGYACCILKEGQNRWLLGCCLHFQVWSLGCISFYSLSLWQISALLLLYSAGQKRGQRAAEGTWQSLLEVRRRCRLNASVGNIGNFKVGSLTFLSPLQGNAAPFVTYIRPLAHSITFLFLFFSKKMDKDVFPTEGSHTDHSVCWGFPHPLLLVGKTRV